MFYVTDGGLGCCKLEHKPCQRFSVPLGYLCCATCTGLSSALPYRLFFYCIAVARRREVDWTRLTCSCHEWTQKGIPCRHAVAANNFREPGERLAGREFFEKAFHKAYHISTLGDMYGGPGVHLALEEHVPSDNMTIAPPLLPGYSGPGRKQLLRRPGDGERRGDGRTSTARPRGRVAAEAGQSGAAVRICTACRLVGHTATVCPSRRSRSAPPSSSRVVAL